MDFADWSPSHLILVAFAIVAFIGHVAIMFYRIAQNDKKIDKLGETFFHALERLEERMDKRIDEVRTETNQRLSDMHDSIRDVRLELSKLSQNYIDHLTQHEQSTLRASNS